MRRDLSYDKYWNSESNIWLKILTLKVFSDVCCLRLTSLNIHIKKTKTDKKKVKMFPQKFYLWEIFNNLFLIFMMYSQLKLLLNYWTFYLLNLNYLYVIWLQWVSEALGIISSFGKKLLQHLYQIVYKFNEDMFYIQPLIDFW